MLGAVRLRNDSRCWLRSENLRMDSRLREASDRNELVLLKSPVPSSPWPVLKKLSAPWRDRRTFPTHPCIWDWATEILSPKYSIAKVEAAESQFWDGFSNPNRGIRKLSNTLFGARAMLHQCFVTERTTRACPARR